MSSKIKVDTIENVAGSGNVSLGSGHNLVVPGNVTGQGTLAITGVSTLTGNVGIGITPDSISNGKALQVNRSLINDDDGGSTHITQNGYYDSAWKYVENGTAEKITFGLGATTFSSATSNSSGADASLTWVNNMVIDANGRVTKPNQPSFLAFGANIGEVSSAGYIAYPNIDTNQGGHNIGSHYNTSTYKFTAPVAGKYLFGFSVYAHTTNALDMYGRLNDSVNVSGHQVNAGSNDDNYPTLAGSVLINMAANDTFGWRMISGSYHTNSTGSYFYGFLSH